jgi:rubrerythrin
MTVHVDFSKLDLQDALDLAVLIEKEAEERYRWFADMLGERYPGDAADFFSMMARNEKRHGTELAERRRALFGDAPSRVTAEMTSRRRQRIAGLMSPRHALKWRWPEIKAWEFFDQARPGISDRAVRELFEDLRDEERIHQGLLEQQKAKYPETMEPDVDPEDVDTPAL